MAEIKIKHTRTIPLNSEETTIEVTGLEYGADTLTNQILEKLREGRLQPEAGELFVEGEAGPEFTAPQQNGPAPGTCNFRMVVSEDISPEDFKTAVAEGNVDELISPYDEIDVPLDTGETVTVVCAYSAPKTARFVFKDCWDEAVMNEEPTNKTGYLKSKGRQHVLEDIWQRIVPEWQAIIKPRKMVEEIDGERVEYADPLWLPSATDVFGPSESGYWKDLDDSFQLPIFKRERDRVKECGDEGTYPYWLRSVNATHTNNFRVVYTGGSGGSYYAYHSWGFAPGFDI